MDFLYVKAVYIPYSYSVYPHHMNYYRTATPSMLSNSHPLSAQMIEKATSVRSRILLIRDGTMLG